MNRLGLLALFAIVACDEAGNTAAGGAGGDATTTSGDLVTTSSTTTDAQTTSSVDGSGSISAESSSTGAPIPVSNVHVVDREGVPVADVLVFSNDATGGLVDSGTSDADGDVEVEVPEGGSLHVAREASVFYDGQLVISRVLLSQFAINSGADVTFRVRKAGVSQNTPVANMPMSLTVFAHTFPENLPVARVSIGLSCSSVAESDQGFVAFDSYKGCAEESTFSILARGYDANDVLIATGTMSALPFEPGTNPTYQVHMDAASSTSTRIELNAPFLAEHMRASYSLRFERFSVGDTADTYDSSNVFVSPEVAPSFAELEWGATANNDVDRTYFRTSRKMTTPLPGTIVVNTTDLAVVRLDTIELAEPQHPSVTASVDPGPIGDFFMTSPYWESPSRRIDWTGYAPVGVGVTMRVPAVPASIEDWLLQPGETLSLPMRVDHVDSDIMQNALDATAVDWTTETERTTYSAYDTL